MFIPISTLVIFGIILFMSDSRDDAMEKEIRENRDKIDDLETKIDTLKNPEVSYYDKFSGIYYGD